jgi:hypothetical protein
MSEFLNGCVPVFKQIILAEFYHVADQNRAGHQQFGGEQIGFPFFSARPLGRQIISEINLQTRVVAVEMDALVMVQKIVTDLVRDGKSLPVRVMFLVDSDERVFVSEPFA